MINIGKYNTLTISREADQGLYLRDAGGGEVLLPRRYVSDEMNIGDSLEVFVYTDSEDRPVATTEHPYATAGQFAFLRVDDVNSVGAFLDWGVLKGLLVPYSEQKSRMVKGGVYPVYVYLDNVTHRVVASARLEHFLGNVYPDYEPGARVSALVIGHNDIGYRLIIDNLHAGMAYNDELTAPLEIGSTVTAHVKKVRDDGKIDVAVGCSAAERVGKLANKVLKSLNAAGGEIGVSDSSSPEEIRRMFGCSKKDFKKALGHLYKNGKIMIAADRISLVK